MHRRRICFLLAAITVALSATSGKSAGPGPTPLPSAVRERLESCDAAVAVANAEALLDGVATTKQPIELLPAAFALLENGRRDQGVFWYYVLQLRLRQQGAIQGGDMDRLIPMVLESAGPIVNSDAMQDIPKLIRTLDRVVAWERRTPNPFAIEAKAAGSEAALDSIVAGIEPFKAYLRTNRAKKE